MKKKSLLSKLFGKNDDSGKNDSTPSESAVERREFIAEQLESRILYSAAPVEAAPEEAVQVAEETVADSNSGFEGVENFEGAIQATDEFGNNELVTLTSLDNLTDDELAALADAATQKWIESGITDEQLAALQSIEYDIVDLEGAYLGSAEGYQIEIDINAAGEGWFIDSTPFDNEEFGFAESSTIFRAEQPETFGVDLLSVLMHEQGHVLGLEDIYDSADDSVMYGLFDEGERRELVGGEADGAVVLSLEGLHYAVFDGAVDGSSGAGVNGDINLADNYQGMLCLLPVQPKPIPKMFSWILPQ